MNYVNFSSSTLKSVGFNHNIIEESNWISCLFKQVQFEDNELNQANFWETNLKGIDFSSNHFETLEVTPDLCRGIKISLAQAPFFTQLHDINIV
ncbi:pentapeptide repeat-containing protein [Lactococcus fujiensis]|nr:pentapeptide repeat-containing protein [Lactococcus fujiensis]